MAAEACWILHARGTMTTRLVFFGYVGPTKTRSGIIVGPIRKGRSIRWPHFGAL